MSESTSTSLKERIALAAARTHRNPSLGQKEAGNYPKGHFPWNGLRIAIETPKGAIRTGITKSGARWAVQMPGHYGYIKRTTSDADGDQVDVIVGPHPESDLVCVVDQKTPGGKFDEHKVVIGCRNVQEARELYLACYSSGWTGMRSITPMTRQQFSVWLRKGDTGRPIDRQVSLYGKFDESDHPRGQPDNAGQFASKDGASTVSRKNKLPSSPEASDLAGKIIDGSVATWGGCVDDPRVMYDATWGNTPHFINIKAKMDGKGLGYTAFLDFLNKVGDGENFTSTDFTDAGMSLFNKATESGLIEQVAKPQGLARISVWKVTKDPSEELKQISVTKIPSRYARDDQPRDADGRFSHTNHVLKTASEIESGWHSGALVSARELRKHAKLSKPDFDRAVYELAMARQITPHKHDFATSLPPGELDELVDTAHGDKSREKIHANDGRYWVGFAKGKGNAEMDKYSRIALAAARFELTQYAKGPAKPAPGQSEFKWITIHPHGHEEGTGTPVKIDGKGNIVGGPKGIADKGIKKLSDFGQGKGTKNTGNGHELAQEDQRRTDAAKERLKDVDVDFKEAKYTVKGNEVVDADGKRHGAFRTPEKAQAAADEWNKNGKPGEKKEGESSPTTASQDPEKSPEDQYNQLPDAVKSHIKFHLGRLQQAHKSIEHANKLGARYGWEVADNPKLAADVAESRAKLDSFRKMAGEKGIDAEAALSHAGGEPSRDVFDKAQAWGHESTRKKSEPAESPSPTVSERTELAAAKARQVGLFSQRELGGAPQLFDTGKEFVKEKKGSPSPVKDAAPSKLEQIEDEIKAKAEESRPLAGQKSLLDQAKDAFADAVDRPATPIEKNGIQMTQATAPGVSHDDIPYESAYRAHARTSFVPEKRARQRQNDYVNQLNSDWEYISSNLAPGQEQAAKEEFERYRDGYKRHYLNALHAASRTMSPMITGPARFPVNSNSKKIDTEMRRYDDLRDFRKKALSAIRKKVAPAGEGGPIKSSDSNVIEALQAKLEGLQKYHEAAKGINKIVRSHVASSDRTAGVTFKPGRSRESAIKEMMALGVSEDTASKALLPDYMGRVGIPGYSLTNNNANMKRIQDRIAEVSKMKSGPAKDNEYSGGVRVSEDPEAARIRMHFPGKPSREVIDHLKSNGFRWSPSEGAWQRHLNSAGRYAVESTLKKFGHEPVAGEASSVPGAEGENEPPELMPMAAEEPEKDNEKYSRAELAAARVDYARETRPIPAPQSRDAHKPAPTPPTSTSGGGKKKSGGGWITLGGGSHVHIGDDGKILHGCPGLKGERVQSLKNESDESRHVREVRQAHAEARGLTGHDVTAGQAKQLASPNKVKQHEVAKQAAKGSGHSTANVLRAMSDAHEMSSADRQMFRPALDRLMKVTGATPAKARDWENVSYKDHSSWPDFDHWARVIAADHPELGMNKDDHDTPAKLWDLLREEGQRTAQDELHSPEIARAAVEMLGKPVRGRKSGRSDQSDTSFDPDSFGDTSFDPDKFSRVQLAQARYQKFATI